MAEWQNRPLDAVYPVVFIDCDQRQDPRRQGRQPADLRRARRSPSTAPATSSGCGPASTATGRARSTGCGCCRRSRTAAPQDVCIVVCDGLKGLPDAIATVWPADDRPDLRRSPAAQQLPLRLEEGLGRDRQGPQAVRCCDVARLMLMSVDVSTILTVSISSGRTSGFLPPRRQWPTPERPGFRGACWLLTGVEPRWFTPRVRWCRGADRRGGRGRRRIGGWLSVLCRIRFCGFVFRRLVAWG